MTVDPLELASALHVDGRLEEAEPLYRQAIAAAPRTRVAHNNLIALLRAQRRWAELETAIRAALELWPEDQTLWMRLATLVLTDGRYAEGWPLYEARRRIEGGAKAPALPQPEWQGEPVRRLLVWHEQGFGDILQFARFLPVLQAKGIAVDFLCPAPLVRLLQAAGLPAQDPVGARIETPDAWVLLGSLPLRLGATLDTLPPPVAISGSDGGRGVGVVAVGKTGHINDRNRSMPPEAAARLMALPGAMSLQPEETGAKDFADTAEIVRGLAAVVTVDTAVAHLAAAMGKPTLILLPYLMTDWRWLRDREDSPWYPSARLYRQPAADAWNPVIDRVAEDVAKLGVG